MMWAYSPFLGKKSQFLYVKRLEIAWNCGAYGQLTETLPCWL